MSEIDKPAIREKVKSIYIPESFFYKVPIATKTIDWGGVSRGQGKRTAGTILGGMSAILGKEVYQGVDLSKYKDDFDKCTYKLKYFNTTQALYYGGARLYGLNHPESIIYALLKWAGRLTCNVDIEKGREVTCINSH